jgi:hypothetical protein
MGKDEDFWKVMGTYEQTLMKKKKNKKPMGVATYFIMWSFWIFLLSWHKWKWLVKCDEVVPITTKQHFTKFYAT